MPWLGCLGWGTHAFVSTSGVSVSRGCMHWGCPAALAVWHQLPWGRVGLRPVSSVVGEGTLRKRCPGSPVSMHRHWVMAPLGVGAGGSLSVLGWLSPKEPDSTLLLSYLHQ